MLIGATVTPELHVPPFLGGTNLQISSGVTFQLTYARRLKSSRGWGLYFEVPALAVPLQNIATTNGVVPRNYDSFFVTPGLRFKLIPTARISPWVSGGGGYTLFDESALRTNGSHNTTRGTSGGAAQFGGGVDIRTPIKTPLPIGLRVEARDLYTSKPTYNVNTGGAFQHNVVLSGGLVLHF